MRKMTSTLPRTIEYDTIVEFILDNCQDDGMCAIGKDTVAYMRPMSKDLVILLRSRDIAVIHPHEHGTSLYTSPRGWGKSSRTYVDRTNRILRPMGYKMVRVGRTWKIYSVPTGAYKDYYNGMFVSRDAAWRF